MTTVLDTVGKVQAGGAGTGLRFGPAYRSHTRRLKMMPVR